MAFQVSPGVQVKEIDVTNVVPAVSTSTGGYAGHFSWGPVDEVRTITSEKGLAQVFGEPSDTNTSREHFYSVASFLKYANNVKVVRANTTNLLNATTLGRSFTTAISTETPGWFMAARNRWGISVSRNSERGRMACWRRRFR